MRVLTCLPPHLKPHAAALYWQAFGSKLGRVLGPEPLAMAYLARVIRGDHCLYVLDDAGDLVGIAGFKSPSGSFANGHPHDMRAVYGVVGAAWRTTALRLLQSDIDNDRFLVDGICVASSHRGQGFGSALLDALVSEARFRGYGAIRLDVIDTNIRARALYERMGFAAWRHETLGPLRHLFGFSRATTMVRAL